MRYSQTLVSSLLFTATVTVAVNAHANLEAHEWGTFTSLVGSNGITQNGMYHEDEQLPRFVHGFGELRAELPPPPIQTPPGTVRPPCHSKICFGSDFLRKNVVTQKMETPVIYFYSDREQNVEVNVQFPEGVVTETYPGPIKTFPSKSDISRIAGGNTTFSVKVLNKKTADLPFVESRNIYAPARLVDSNIVSSGSEQEKFIFYRGIGRFQPHVAITSMNGALSLRAPDAFNPQAAFLVHVDANGSGQMIRVGNANGPGGTVISSHAIQQLMTHGEVLNPSNAPSIVSGEQALGMLADALIQSGLRRDEALAMVHTWENGYLKVPGLRLLYILPRNEVDQVLPLQITPAPNAMVRTFVGRIEILLDTEEKRILGDIINQTDSYRVDSLGRFAEPILRRVSEVYRQKADASPEIIGLLARLIEKSTVADTGSSSVH